MSAGTFSLRTKAHMELVDITDTVQAILREHKITSGYCYLFNPHTTAGLTINEGADPDVRRDIIDALRSIVPLDFNYRHREGNSPSHVMASLMGSSLTIAVENGRLQLGTWQHLFFCEFDGPRTRSLHWRLDRHIH
jgi:secondary thiamine-phosphate synthase enzyme